MSQYFTNDESLKSKYRNIIYKYETNEFNFISDLGVFSKNRVDYASKLLIENYFKSNNENKYVLDVGCGYGLIGITISSIMDSKVDMVDVNNRAIHLTEINIKNNKSNCNVFYSDCYNEINNIYDCIITNPPIRAGKKVYMKILENAKDFLKENGELWFVISKDQGAKSIEKKLQNIYDVNVIDKSKGFFVFLCKKH